MDDTKKAVASAQERGITHSIDIDVVEMELDKSKDAKSNGNYLDSMVLAIGNKALSFYLGKTKANQLISEVKEREKKGGIKKQRFY